MLQFNIIAKKNAEICYFFAQQNIRHEWSLCNLWHYNAIYISLNLLSRLFVLFWIQYEYIYV